MRPDVLCLTDVSLYPFFVESNKVLINQLIGEYWCMGFEIDMASPITTDFSPLIGVSVDRFFR